MSLRPGEVAGRGIAVFPFLKTSQPVRLGSFTFRSTDDTMDLNSEDSARIREVAEMLFLQDDLRIRSAAYALLPPLDLDKPQPCLAELEHLQAIVAYCYSAPHPVFGSPFLHFEQASLAVFSPEPVPILLVRPDYHVELLSPDSALVPDAWHCVPGYQGRYNFHRPFWVAKGSRLYPPMPHMDLNISQDLAVDLGRCFGEAPQHHLLPELLHEPKTATAERVLTALAWYNRANALAGDEDSAIIDLAVAFEALLALPKDAKTDRFVDAISLLLGRIPRLSLWAEQFYDARSNVAHEGRARQIRFVPMKSKSPANGPFYHSLLAYGRQIFQLCVGTLLFGAYLGVRAGLPEKLVTNQERFLFICKTLDDQALGLIERFAAIDDAIALIDCYRFVPETGLLIETMIGAVRQAASLLPSCADSLDPLFKQRAEALAAAPRSADWYAALAALQGLSDVKIARDNPRSPEAIMARLVEIVWHYTFMHYFWLKEQRTKGANQSAAT